MSTIQSLGIGSGLEIDSIVTAIVDSEKVPQTKALDKKQEITTAKISAYGEIKSRLSVFQTSVAALRSPTNFNKNSATSSDEATFTATASPQAEPGSYSVQVDSLAKAQSLATGTFEGIDEAIGTGSLSIAIGETSAEPPYSFAADTSVAPQEIVIDETNNTLSTLKDHINSNEYGFTASIINNGNGFQLVLSGESGAQNSLAISVSGDGDGNDADAGGLSRLRFDDTAQNLTQSVAATNANVTINGIAITAETNTVSNAINGVDIALKNTDVGVAKNLQISASQEGLKEQVTTMVESYNEFAVYVAELTAYNPGNREGSLLLGDSTTRSIMGQLRSTMLSQVTGIDGSGLQALSNIGILTKQSDGSLEFDESKFDKAMTDQPEDFLGLFSTSGQSTDANIQFISNSRFTKTGTYDVEISQIATQGNITSSGGLPDFANGGSLTIDDNNDDFEVRLNGTLSGPLKIAQGEYTSGSELAGAIQNAINSSSALQAKNSSVSASYDPTAQAMTFTSAIYGSDSTIAFTSIDADTTASLGLSVAAGTNGLNVQGTINGAKANGSGQFLSATEGDAQGIKLNVSGGEISSETNNRGSVTFSRGIADKLNDLLDSFLDDTGGFLTTREQGLETTLDTIEKDRLDLTYDMDRLEQRLLDQFNAIDLVVNQLNGLGSFLTSALETIPKPGSVKSK